MYKFKVYQFAKWSSDIEMLDKLHKPYSFQLSGKKHITPNSLLDFITFDQRMELDKLVTITDELQLLVKLISLVFEAPERHVLKMKIIEAYPLAVWILKDYIELTKLEADKLTVNPSTEEKRAEVERLNVFGYFPIIDRCMKDYNLTFEQVGKLSYSFIFTKQFREAEEIKYQRRLNKVIYSEK